MSINFYGSHTKEPEEKIVVFSGFHLKDRPDLYKDALEGVFIHEKPISNLRAMLMPVFKRKDMPGVELAYQGKFIPLECIAEVNEFLQANGVEVPEGDDSVIEAYSEPTNP